MRETVIDRIVERKIIAIVRGVAADDTIPLAQALLDGGIDLMEVTFDQSAGGDFSGTVKAIEAVSSHFDGRLCVGAGTVLTPEQVTLAHQAGAKYIISPNADTDVIRATRALGLVSIPGVLTPTEIVAAHRAGADFAKLFPASTLGSDYIKAIRAPLSHIRLLAVGGVDAGNIPAFLAAGCLGFGIGGSLINQDWIKAGQYKKVTEAARWLCRAAGCGTDC